MSYTIIRDYAEERREFENRINAVLRHCRVGKVTKKPAKPLYEQLSGIARPARPTGWRPSVGAPHPYFSS